MVTNLNTVECFSDGATSQYKNYKKSYKTFACIIRTSVSSGLALFLPPAT